MWRRHDVVYLVSGERIVLPFFLSFSFHFFSTCQIRRQGTKQTTCYVKMVLWHDIASSAIIARNRLITTTNPYSAFLFRYHRPLYIVVYRPNLAIHWFLSSSKEEGGHLSGSLFSFILFWQIIQLFVVVARRIRAVGRLYNFRSYIQDVWETKEREKSWKRRNKKENGSCRREDNWSCVYFEGSDNLIWSVMHSTAFVLKGDYNPSWL